MRREETESSKRDERFEDDKEWSKGACELCAFSASWSGCFGHEAGPDAPPFLGVRAVVGPLTRNVVG